MEQKRYVIIGAGETGVAAAEAIRHGDPEGRIQLFSSESALPYERPPLSKEVLTDVDLQTLKSIRPEQWYLDNHIELLLGATVTEIDTGAQKVFASLQGNILEANYDRLLLATGASVRTIPDSEESAALWYLRTWEDALSLREKLAVADSILIIGGGVIGLEVASSAVALGKSVVVIELASRLMARAVAPEISGEILSLHLENGVDVRLNTEIISSVTTEGGIECTLGDGTVLKTDMAIAGIGVMPNTSLAESAGCRIGNGIAVNGRGETSVENIYAAGDVAAFSHPVYGAGLRLESWRHAQRHGAHVGRAMAGETASYGELPWFWTDQHGVNFQVTGIAPDHCETYWRGDDRTKTAMHFDGDRLVAVTTMNNGRDMRPLGKLISAGWRGEVSPLLATDQPLGKICNTLISTMKRGS